MKKNVLFSVLAYFSLIFYAQSQDLSALNDSFDNAESLSKWKSFSQVEGFPDKMLKSEVKDGKWILEPSTSGWFNDYQAPFFYKEVTGDFDVRAKVKATALDGGIPQTTWSLGGLMVRVPKRTNKETWQPRQENWLFMTTGVAADAGKQVIESKYTLNSRSNLKLRDAKAEWIHLRIVRIGHAFVLMYRYDNEKKWSVHERFYIQGFPETLQVGFNCYTNSEALPEEVRWGDPRVQNENVYNNIGKPDLRLIVDEVTFSKPKISFADADGYKNWYNNVSKNNITDYSLSNKDLVKMLGE
jgi:hypothetical protein